MTKNRVVERLYKASEDFSSKAQAARVYDHVVSAFVHELQETGSLRIWGLGTFAVVDCAEKKYRSPSTREIVIAPAHKKLRFRQSKVFYDEINDKK